MSDQEPRYYQWDLGDNYDCETCGYSWNQANLELWDEDTNVWQLSYHVGCYGGDSAMSNEPEWGDKVEEIIKHLCKYPGFGRTEEKELRTYLKDIK